MRARPCFLQRSKFEKTNFSLGSAFYITLILQTGYMSMCQPVISFYFDKDKIRYQHRGLTVNFVAISKSCLMLGPCNNVSIVLSLLPQSVPGRV